MISLKAARFPKDGLLHQAPRLLVRTASGARAMPPRSLLWSRRFSHISAVPSPRRENLLTFMKHERLIRRCGNLAICYPQGEKGHGQNTSHCLVTTRSPNQMLGTGNGKERGPTRVATRASEIQGRNTRSCIANDSQRRRCGRRPAGIGVDACIRAPIPIPFDRLMSLNGSWSDLWYLEKRRISEMRIRSGQGKSPLSGERFGMQSWQNRKDVKVMIILKI